MDPFIVKKKSKNKKSEESLLLNHTGKTLLKRKKEKHLKQILHLTLRDDRLHEQDYQTATKRVNSP